MPVNRMSLCNVPRDIPINWLDFIDQKHPSVIELEMFIDSLLLPARLLLLGKIQDLKARAALGRIPLDSREFEPISLYPELFELKWQASSGSGSRVQIRQYHAEPQVIPNLLVALHIHIKRILSDQSIVTELQNIEISYAKFRLEAGRKQNWVV